MKKYVILMLAIFLVVSVSGCTSDMKMKTFSKEGISFEYPEEWSYHSTNVSTSLNGNAFKMLGRVSPTNDTGVAVRAQETTYSGGIPSLEYFESQFKLRYNNSGSLINSTPIEINGLQAIEMNGLFTNTIQEKMIFMIKGDTLYQVIMVSPPDKYASYESIFDQIKNSIKIE